ncbi:MAG TPA: TrmO family methyltransferase [Steroidobacteraceae bacterium]
MLPPAPGAVKTAEQAPKQASEGTPDAGLEVSAFAAAALEGLAAGDDIIVVTWLHRAQRDVLKVHPRGDERSPLTGVFATRRLTGRTRSASIA